MISNFGTRLRSHRERRGIDLDTIAHRTKIGVGHLVALERDDPSRWPPGIFRRGFIRAYATAVGLDPESTLQEFLERFPDPFDEACGPVRRGGRTHAAPRLSSGIPGEPLRLTLADERDEPVREGDLTHVMPRLSCGIPGEPPRLMLADVPRLSKRSYMRALRSPWPRVAAATCDLAFVVAIAAAFFAVGGTFWTPFTVATLCYYFVGVLIVGTSPAAWILGRDQQTPVGGQQIAAPETLSGPGEVEEDHLTPLHVVRVKETVSGFSEETLSSESPRAAEVVDSPASVAVTSAA
jgi:hypothetical protein